MGRFRYLTFDCYGTIVDWRAGIERALTAATGPLPVSGADLLAKYVELEAQSEGSYMKYRDVLALTAKRLAAEFGADLPPEKAAEFGASVPDWPAFPDSSAALKKLGGMGHKRYVLSNVDTDLLEETLRAASLEVDGYVTAEEVGSYKPSHAHWTAFLERTGTEEREVLHVAQSVYHDIVPAAELGIETAWVNRYSEPMPPDIRPLYVSDSLEHLAEIID